MDTTVAALASGDDVRIVYQTDTDIVELDRIGDAWNSTNTTISFKIQSEIPADAERGSGHYFVYYNNPQAGLPPATPANVYIFYDDFNRPNFMVVGNSWIEDEQRDPLQGKKEAPQTLNRYVYCLNNPLKYIDPAGTEGVSAQDKVEEVFQRLQDVDPEELAEIQELLDNKKITELQALKMVLELLGFDVTETNNDTLSIMIGDKSWTVKVNNTLKVRGQDAYGEANDNNFTISINFNLCDTVGGVALTVLHEVSHAVLGCKDESQKHKYIYSIQYQYMTALYKLGVDFSQKYMDHIGLRSKQYDPNKIYRIPIVEICKKWVRGWKRW